MTMIAIPGPFAPDEAGSTTYGQLTITQLGTQVNAVSLRLELCLAFTGQPTGPATSSLELVLNPTDAQRFVEQWCGDEVRRLIEQTMQLANARYWEGVTEKAKQLTNPADSEATRQQLYTGHQARVDTALTLEGAQALYHTALRFLAAPPVK